MLFQKKIPCYVMVFDQVEIVRQTLECLARYAKRLELVVMENPSPNTPEISQIIDRLGKAGAIKRYYLFDENIISSAFDVVLGHELERVRRSPYVMVTDGDMTVADAGWIDEQLRVLKRHPEVFACGVSLDMSNLPLAAFPDADGWIPPDIHDHGDYIEAITGAHLVLLRGTELAGFMDWKNAHDRNFVDGELHKYCQDVLGKRWSRTRKAKAYHLTWDLYLDKSHPYTKMKLEKSFEDLWHRQRTAGFTLVEY